MGRVIDMPVRNYTSASAALADNQRRISYLTRKRVTMITDAVTDSERLHDHIQNLGQQIDLLDQLADSLRCRNLAAPPREQTQALRTGLSHATKILTEAIVDLAAGPVDISKSI